MCSQVKVCITQLSIPNSINFQAISEEQKSRFRDYSRECQRKTGVAQDAIISARMGEFSDDPKLKEHLLCFAKRAGFMNEAGVVMAEPIKAMVATEVGPEEADNVAEECASLRAATPQQVAFDVFRCFYESTSKRLSLT